MEPIRNTAKERLARGELCIGLSLHLARTVHIGRMMATAGFDFAFIDMEHNAMNLDAAGQIAVAAHDAGVTPLVRVPGYEPFHTTRVLDAGAMGIVFPHVDSAAHAKELVSMCKYPPLGHRSAMGAMPQVAYRAVPVGEVTEALNASMLLVMMLESPEAIDQADAIAAVEGVDVLMIGTNDLCMEMGLPGQFGSPQVKAAYRRVIDACRRHGKHAGLGGIRDQELTSEYLRMGCRFLTGGVDQGLLMGAMNQRVSFLRGIDL